MNCERFQENLPEYLDDSLSPSEKTAAQQHLAGCAACRAVKQSELRLGQSLSRRLEQAVETVALDASAQHRMAMAVQRELAASPKLPPVSIWSRLVLPFAVAAIILLTAIGLGHHFVAGRRPPRVDRGIFVHISYSAPSYTFRKEGNLIVDALVSDTRVADGALLVEN